VYDYLKRNGNFENITAQDKKHHLAYLNGKDKKFQLKPDIVINGGKIIADTKWKLLSEDKTHQGISQGDMYQLYAYGTKYRDCQYLYLIYPYDGVDISNAYQYFEEKDVYECKKELHLNVLLFDVTHDNSETLAFKIGQEKNYEILKMCNHRAR
jgi:5-methylcytosine-specific restriction enzyme subunit McrC